jgi:hypothetical protein
MGHDDLLGEDLFASELDEGFLDDDLPEDVDPLEDVLEEDEDAEEDEDDPDYISGYNPEEWN